MDKDDVILQESGKAFSQEQGRAERLSAAAEKYVGAVAVIIGFKLIDMENISLSGSWQEVVHGWLTILALSVLAGCLVLSLLSMRVFKYLSYPRGTTLIDELKDASITDQIAKIKVARMYLNAHDNNAGINDQRAKLLSISAALLISGALLAVISFLSRLVD